MAKKQEENVEEQEVVVDDEQRVGVGPHDNVTPAQLEQEKLDESRLAEIEEE